MYQGKKYHIITFGCQMNEADTEVLSGIIESMGYEHTETVGEADLLVLITCAVRQKAEEKAATLLGKLRPWKEEQPHRLLAVGGCMSQQEEVAGYLKRKFPHVDIIFGTHSLPHFPRLLEEAVERSGVVVDIEEKYPERQGLPVRRKSTFQAWVPVVFGCNNFCSYCIVPYVRGRERSRPYEEVLQEAGKLGRQGYKEITLLGQNVDAYGKDLPGQPDLAALLKELNGIHGMERIRFLTSHPRDFNRRIVKAVSDLDKVCEHIHLPLQSGSNRILERMNRGYSRERYLELIDSIKKHVEDVSVTTDVIVGFPGETEKDFEDTMEMMEKVRFHSAYTFIYSPRRGTPAAGMEDDIPSRIKKERIQRLIHRQKSIGLEINRTLEGKTLPVLVEGVSKENSRMLTGRTRTNKLVHFEGPLRLQGEECLVKVKEAKTWHLQGEPVKAPAL